ncbi:hypothetical protein RZ76_13870 [Apilactobacillus kunkeei]|uniref:AlbA family DNA-binding domain-containing protein n=1 Tax=Apilactobacillus kunkeei TaxID=148814 RepID=UPI0006CE9C61|nr:ATP-binding protein [Apilactobacillus kunkeei]KPN83317.1 hypothetical protein RZ76_13870 [Apilactobacillus kunkeei]
MNEENFKDKIINLIFAKKETSNCDFKKNWHASKLSLLHDIICMANTTNEDDAYLIIGVDEDNNFALVDCCNDPNRKNNNELTTFLRDKHFVGSVRPKVEIKSLNIEDCKIDIIVIKNTSQTPYMLDKDFSENKKSLHNHYIYTRVNDANTAKDKNADIDVIESLWKKRFGLNLDTNDRLDFYLSKIENWEYNDYQERFYYKEDPRFKIKINKNENLQDRSEFYNYLSAGNDEFYWSRYQIYFDSEIISEGYCCFYDYKLKIEQVPNIDFLTLKQRKNNYYEPPFKYYYFIKEEKEFKVNQIFKKYNKLYGAEEDWSDLIEFLIIYNNKEEKQEFESYMKNKSYSELEESMNNNKNNILNSDKLNDVENKEYSLLQELKNLFEHYMYAKQKNG